MFWLVGPRDALFSLSDTGEITSLNPAFETITGWKRRDRIGPHFIHLVDARDLGEAILVIEDETDVRQIVAAVLARHGYRVTVATDGADPGDAFLLKPFRPETLLSEVHRLLTRAPRRGRTFICAGLA